MAKVASVIADWMPTTHCRMRSSAFVASGSRSTRVTACAPMRWRWIGPEPDLIRRLGERLRLRIRRTSVRSYLSPVGYSPEWAVSAHSMMDSKSTTTRSPRSRIARSNACMTRPSDSEAEIVASRSRAAIFTSTNSPARTKAVAIRPVRPRRVGIPPKRRLPQGSSRTCPSGRAPPPSSSAQARRAWRRLPQPCLSSSAPVVVSVLSSRGADWVRRCVRRRKTAHFRALRPLGTSHRRDQHGSSERLPWSGWKCSLAGTEFQPNAISLMHDVTNLDTLI